MKGDPAWQAESELHVFHSKLLESTVQDVLQSEFARSMAVRVLSKMLETALAAEMALVLDEP